MRQLSTCTAHWRDPDAHLLLGGSRHEPGVLRLEARHGLLQRSDRALHLLLNQLPKRGCGRPTQWGIWRGRPTWRGAPVCNVTVDEAALRSYPRRLQ